MNQKQRFINTLKYRPVDRVPNMEISIWGQTKDEWIKQGMPEDAVEDTFLLKGSDYFKLEGTDWVDIESVRPYPFQKEEIEEIIEEDERTFIFRDNIGRIRKALKEGTVGGTRLSMDTYLSFPIKDISDFLEHKKGYEGNIEKRYPENWEDVKEAAIKTSRPLYLQISGGFGYYSILRDRIGTEALSYMFYDDPVLINECLEFFTEYIIKLYKKALDEIKFDIMVIHEDLCYKNGPLVSPEIFKKFFLPHYKIFVDYLKKNGVEIVFVDTDGDFEKLVPLFLEAGVDAFGPLEVAAGMDPVYLRNKFGKSFSMWGGVDKRELAKGKKEIEAVIKHIAPIVEQGGYLPTVDHAVQPGVSLENFKYYLKLKRKVLGYKED